MDYNKPWGWQPQRAAAPLGNTVAPLAASAPSMPENVMLPEDPNKRVMREVGTAIGMKALDKAMAPSAASVGSVAQDSATKAALFSDVGYGVPMSTAATDVASGAATDAVGEAATSGMTAVPFAGVLKSLAEGEYVQAGAQAAGTAVAGPLGGLAAKYATKLIGLADGTTSVPAPLSGVDRAAARAAAGARFAPELFSAVNAPSVPSRAAIPMIPARANAMAGGKDAALAGVAQAAQPRRSSIVMPTATAPAPLPKMQIPYRPFYNPMYDNVEVGGA